MSQEIQEPSMTKWTKAWHRVEQEALRSFYSKEAIIFPANKASVKGNDNILAFMQGGLGKVDVRFEPDKLILSKELAFEYGDFKDIERNTDIVIAQGKYSVTWILENNEWKILNHVWSIPSKL